VTEPGSVLLDRAQIERAFTALGDRLVRCGVVLEEARNVAEDAARTRDIDDLRLLADIIGVDTAETALQICAEFFPEKEVPPRAAAVLQELFTAWCAINAGACWPGGLACWGYRSAARSETRPAMAA
jgi:hypothetical protein